MLRLLLTLVLASLTIYLTAQNKVGIGTTAPADLLHVKGGDLRVENSDFPKIKLYQGTTEAGVVELNGSNFWISNKRPGTIHFRTQETARMSIANNGYVGIGAIAPADRLHVQDGDIRLQGENLFFNLHAMHASLPSGIRYYDLSGFQGGMFYSPAQNTVNLTRSANDDGLIMDFNNNYVGIGTNSPSHLLDIAGKMRIGNDGTTPVAGTMRYSSGSFAGYDGAQWIDFGGGDSHWSKTNNRIYYNDGAVLVGRSTTIGAERFGVRYPVTAGIYGGMYIETNGHADSKPFYGYAIDNNGKMWHYYDGASEDWRVYNSGNRFTVESDGDVGVGTTEPDAPLHVAGGNNWDLTNTEGDFKIGNSSYRILMGLAIDGVGAGTARIYSKGGAARLILGGDDTDAMTILPNGRVGIGINDPLHALHVYRPTSSYKVMFESDSGAPDLVLDYDNPVNDNSSLTFQNAGSFMGSIGYNSVDEQIFIYESGSCLIAKDDRVGISMAPNTSYKLSVENSAVIQSTSGASNLTLDYSAGTSANSQIIFREEGSYKGAVGYDPDNEYVFIYEGGNALYAQNGRVGIGTEPNPNYKLSVDGKIIGEEVKVQLSQNWPDYVFKEDYRLPSLAELEDHIATQGHLPGVPSADEINAAEGFEVGEMNRALLEKVEELTLYILQQDKRLAQQEKRIAELEANHQ